MQLDPETSSEPPEIRQGNEALDFATSLGPTFEQALDKPLHKVCMKGNGRWIYIYSTACAVIPWTQYGIKKVVRVVVPGERHPVFLPR